MKTDFRAAVEGFRLLADPKRFAILQLLAKGPRNVTAIAKALRVEITFTGGPLNLLRMGRLVKRERKGRVITYSLDRASMKALASGFKTVMPK